MIHCSWLSSMSSDLPMLGSAMVADTAFAA
jgi:hypothetical protein